MSEDFAKEWVIQATINKNEAAVRYEELLAVKSSMVKEAFEWYKESIRQLNQAITYSKGEK